MKLLTLADARDLADKAPARTVPPEAIVATRLETEIAKAAEGEKDLLEVCVSLRPVLALEGVECLMKWSSAAFRDLGH
jgi:hypothetical protein